MSRAASRISCRSRVFCRARRSRTPTRLPLDVGVETPSRHLTVLIIRTLMARVKPGRGTEVFSTGYPHLGTEVDDQAHSDLRPRSWITCGKHLRPPLC